MMVRDRLRRPRACSLPPRWAIPQPIQPRSALSSPRLDSEWKELFDWADNFFKGVPAIAPRDRTRGRPPPAGEGVCIGSDSDDTSRATFFRFLVFGRWRHDRPTRSLSRPPAAFQGSGPGAPSGSECPVTSDSECCLGPKPDVIDSDSEPHLSVIDCGSDLFAVSTDDDNLPSCDWCGRIPVDAESFARIVVMPRLTLCHPCSAVWHLREAVISEGASAKDQDLDILEMHVQGITEWFERRCNWRRRQHLN